MFIHDETKSLFQCMYDFDGSSDPEQRWKDLRNGVYHYNGYAGTKHELTKEILALYWVWHSAWH